MANKIKKNLIGILFEEKTDKILYLKNSNRRN